MRAFRWDDPGAFDEVLLLAAADGEHRRLVQDRLGRVRGRTRAAELGSYPRFKLVTASRGSDALRRAATATVAAVDLAFSSGAGLETVRELREAHPGLAILAFATASGASDAVAAVMAGADMFYDCKDESATGLARALELAIDRRRLTHSIEKNEEELEAARASLSKLSGDLVGAVPGLWPLRAREDVLPFREAARRYLLNATRFYAGDARGLAAALGVSYFALRRLLARYDVAFPSARARR
jgi:ActR/RegA family two-component response regulator